jgi:hypothetical protein
MCFFSLLPSLIFTERDLQWIDLLIIFHLKRQPNMNHGKTATLGCSRRAGQSKRHTGLRRPARASRVHSRARAPGLPLLWAAQRVSCAVLPVPAHSLAGVSPRAHTGHSKHAAVRRTCSGGNDRRPHRRLRLPLGNLAEIFGSY